MSYIKNNQVEYINKVYAGWLGKMIGVRHGANIEGWTYDQIEKTYGEITDYIVDFKNFASDDDINGPLFFQRALEDSRCSRDITPEEMGKAWLNYIPYPSLPNGFLWFGGYGISTEHTAYINMINGIKPPQSGSMKQNGPTIAEQIGGQIFSDCWGLVAPGDPELASDLAEKMASVSHDGNGIYGGRFISAAISLAFIEKDIETIIEKALTYIPEVCDYTIMSRNVIKFYKENSRKNWRDCFKYIYKNYGYDKYPGNCHIMPNSAVIIMALLYSEGDYSKGINISNMAGWDTDCNVGNIGTILGVFNGVDGIESKWIEPISDFVCCSNVIGSLNILDIPWMASDTSRLGFSLANCKIPDEWKERLEKKSISCHFEYPESTHSIRGVTESKSKIIFRNSSDVSYTGKRSLKIVIPQFTTATSNRVFLKTYYQSSDFDDCRYSPSFSPICYPGSSFSGQFYIPEDVLRNKEEIKILPYCRSVMGELIFGPSQVLKSGEWNKISWTIPSDLPGIEEIGFDLRTLHAMRDTTEDSGHSMIFYLDDFAFTDCADYSIDTKNDLFVDTWTYLHKPVSQFVKNRGMWNLEDGMLTGSNAPSLEQGDIFTGNYYWKDYSLSATIKPITGETHGISFRVNGAMTGYVLHLDKNSTLVLKKNNYQLETLTSIHFNWDTGIDYTLTITVIGSRINIIYDGLTIISYEDCDKPYLSGCIGFSVIQSRMGIKNYKIKTLNDTI